jgi:hypothetical protein
MISLADFCHGWVGAIWGYRNNQNRPSSIFISEQKLHYTFSFPQSGSNFTCIRSTSCPPMNSPPQCPPGYNEVRENSTCGLYCRDIVGYTWRCPCNDWMSCAVKERYLWGCASGYYSSFRVRECAQGLFVMYSFKNCKSCIVSLCSVRGKFGFGTFNDLNLMIF